MKTNLILIGFMGTGKTTVGRTLARLLDKEFMDTDSEIEKVVGLKIEDIFNRYGEIRFRSEESLVVQKLARRQNQVISTGGGVVLNPENVRALKATGYLVCLQAAPEVIQSRVSRRIRPLLRKDNSLERIKELLKERETSYRGADLYVDTSNCTQEEVVNQIYAWWQQKIKEEIEG
ncbi:MAG: shikimate kinase [Syntrophomonadaceae bacterium]|nr:shikimate kinase [Syntrophomonadaceae bacterium]